MAIALVAHATAVGSSSPSTSAIDTTGATLLVAFLTCEGATTASDSKGNTWTYLTIRSNGPNAKIGYVVNPTVGSGHTFTCNGGYAAASFSAWSGAHASTPFDVEVGGTSSAATQSVIGSSTLTPAENNELIVSAVTINGGISAHAGANGFTVLDFINYGGGNNYGGAALYQIQTSAAAVNNATAISNWTTSQNIAYASAAFKSAVGGGAAFIAPPGKLILQAVNRASRY